MPIRFPHRSFIHIAGGALGVFAFAAACIAQPIIAESRFTTDRDGWDVWTDIGNTVMPSWQIDTGNPGGCIFETDTDGGISYWRAPAKFLGNKSAAYRGTLSFDLRESGSGTLEGSDLILRGAGIELHYSTTQNPESSRFSRYHIPLLEAAAWKIGSLSGVQATATQLQQVLGNLTGILIRAEYVNGPDNGWLDNVVLRQPRVGLPSSTFDANSEDWWVLGDGELPIWSATGGNPGGSIRSIDFGTGPVWKFLAPSKFVGDLSQAYGGRIDLDLNCSANDSPTGAANIVIESDALRLEYRSGAVPPVNVWSHQSAPLFPTAQWTLNGATPTPAAFLQALRAVTAIEIRGEFSATLDTGKLDNVFVRSGCPGDLNADGLVDDTDFSQFGLAYNILDCADPAMAAGCPADFNRDGVVDDSDFSVFVVAYNELLCP